MDYWVYFASNRALFLKNGLKRKKDALESLVEIAGLYYSEGCIGELYKKEKGNDKLIEEYKPLKIGDKIKLRKL